jgi:spermidine/putrescine transport system ATP-binding protein
MESFFKLEGIRKSFGAHAALRDVTIEVRRGEVFSLLGPSGCGKTTLLRIAAGFETPDAGRVFLDGSEITVLPPDRRRINTVFQNYALFPHMTVWDNIAFGPRVARRQEREIGEDVGRMLEMVGLGGHAAKKPGQLSGGEKQRVALARALINRPQVLLLDEPLAALDLKLRQRLLLELDRIHDEVGTTFVYVTHDQEEAMSLSDRIAVMNAGCVEQIGTAAEVYEAPTTRFVAEFIGDTNLLEGTVGGKLDAEFTRMEVDGLGDIVAFNDKRLPEGGRVLLSLRPEKLHLTRERPASVACCNAVQARVEDVSYRGAETRYWVRSGACRLAVVEQNARFLLDEKPITWDETVWVFWHGNDGFMIGPGENGGPAPA